MKRFHDKQVVETGPTTLYYYANYLCKKRKTKNERREGQEKKEMESIPPFFFFFFFGLEQLFKNVMRHSCIIFFKKRQKTELVTNVGSSKNRVVER